MRVTQKTLFGNFMRDININRGELGKVQSDLSSGREVRVPSHDPVSFQQSRVIGENIRKEEQFQRNISSGLRQARLAQEAMEQSLDSLIDIKQLLVKGANQTNDARVRENMADELVGIRDSLVNLYNSNYGDRYLFAGTNSDQPPFEVNGNGPGEVENRSNATPPNVLAGDGVRINISIDGQELRDTPGGDLFEVIHDIDTALRDDDSGALTALMDDMDEVIEHVTHANSRLGSQINQLDFMYDRYSSSTISQKSDVSELVDTDYAQAFSELQRIQTAYESAMAVHSTMFSNSLLDYI